MADADLSGERYAVLFLDGFHLKVRLARRVIAVPVLAALGVTEHGQKRLVALQLAATEATTSWSGLLTDLQRRGLSAPLLVVTDGHAGLKKALEVWSTVRVQRCTTHKPATSKTRVPFTPRRDETGLPPDHSRRRWPRRACGVRRVREEVDDALSSRGTIDRRGRLRSPHLLRFSEGDVEVVAHTNTLENLNREFRRRTKTQASFGTEAAALTLLYGLVAFGQIVLRRIDGREQLTAFLPKEWFQAA